MTRPTKLSGVALKTWLDAHPGWSPEQGALVRSYHLPDYGSVIALAVRIALAAEKRDHHPELQLRWGVATVRWSTHDAGGITALDLELAQVCDGLAL